MTNTVVTEKAQLEAEKLYRVSQVLPLFSGKLSHNKVRALFQKQPEVQRGKKADAKVNKSSRYFLPGSAVARLVEQA